ncbi:unnamed protein product [Rangifer tarandus platyrhynchus]|uniref:Uncharacterized protein n=2 Tax=Rangifer tarandus platyrhynchus TaxID=3082113 RepID=A0ACB0F0B7_RANTA|nr:unnamed protein product [Rangifer tarandus platyrhynchus]CAI9705621.1 unnamed protein product [Rangifer tarandus platyrhynchus]
MRRTGGRDKPGDVIGFVMSPSLAAAPLRSLRAGDVTVGTRADKCALEGLSNAGGLSCRERGGTNATADAVWRPHRQGLSPLTDWLRPRRDLCAPANPSRPS